MEFIEADSPHNIAWLWVFKLRGFLLWPILIAVGFFIVISILDSIDAKRRSAQEAAQRASDREHQRQDHEAWQINYDLKEIQKRQMEEQDKLQKEKDYQERLRKKFLEKQNRSAQDATRAALDDF